MSAKPPIALTWDGRMFRPADAWAAEQAAVLPKGDRLNAHITRAKAKNDFRAGLNALYWAGLGLLVQNFSEDDEKRWPTARKVHNLLLEEHGYVDKIYRIDKTYRLVPDSVAFDAMIDDDFAVYVEKARAFMVEHWGYDPLDAWVENKEAQNKHL